MSSTPMSSKLKPLQDGKLSFIMPEDLREVLIKALHHRVQNEKDSLEHHTYFGLLEVHSRMVKQIDKKRTSLLCSHFYVLFSAETMAYVNESTQNLIRAHLHDMNDSSPLRLNKTNILYTDIERASTYPHDWSKHYVPLTAEEAMNVSI